MAGTARASSSTVPAGSAQQIVGSGFRPGESVPGWLHSTPIDLGVRLADQHGDVRFTFTVPHELEPGDLTVLLIGVASGERDTASFVVTPQAAAEGTGGSRPATGPASSLSNTGVDPWTKPWMALLLVLVGAGLLTVVSRGRPPPEPPVIAASRAHRQPPR